MTKKEKWVAVAVGVATIVGVLALIHYLPFWSVLVAAGAFAVGAYAGWAVKKYRCEKTLVQMDTFWKKFSAMTKENHVKLLKEKDLKIMNLTKDLEALANADKAIKPCACEAPEPKPKSKKKK